MQKITLSLFMLLFFIAVKNEASAQIGGNDRDVAIGMLEQTIDAIKKNYYDPKYHGVDVDFVFEQAKEKMKTDPNRDALMMTIASAVLTLNDSHTTFFPPARAADIDYGWRLAMVGDDCFVMGVKPRSDAEAKGLKAGDKLLFIDGLKPTRANDWKLYYRYFAVAPVSKVSMTVLSPGDEKPRALQIQTKISKTAREIDPGAWYVKYYLRKEGDIGEKLHQSYEFGQDLMIWRMSSFSGEESQIEALINKARRHKTLILDLRDNGGGSVEIEKKLIGSFFDKEIKIGDEKSRKESKERLTKNQGDNVFKGDLIVLVNRDSASATEVFARTIQLQKRGKIIGDNTAGAVMTSKFYDMNSGIGSTLYFGASITWADFIMPDGKSLEKIGVTPDEKVLPTSQDIAESKDPALSYAAKLGGVDITPQKAGTLFPYVWPK